MRPNVLTAAAIIASTSAGFDTSPSTGRPAPPALSISLTTESACSRLERTLTTTAAPPAASSSAIARPILRPAAVTTATRPSSSFALSAIHLPLQPRQIDPAIVKPGGELQRRRGLRIIPAAMPAAQREFVLDVRARQRLVGAAAHMRLALLDDAAVVELGADVAGELVRIRIGGIDHVAHLAGERDDLGILHGRVGEVAEPDIPAHQRRGDAIGLRELAGVAVGRT